MPKRPSSAEACLEQYLAHMARRSIVPNTINAYRRDIKRLLAPVKAMGRDIHPDSITRRDVEAAMAAMKLRRLTPDTQKRYMQALKGYLRYHGNPVIEKMDIYFPSSQNRQVDWLSPQEAQQLLEAVETPLQEFVIHFELCLGLRRIEVHRLKLSSFQAGNIQIQGKGRGGAQWRTIPYHPDTQKILNRWMTHRQKMVDEYLRNKPGGKVPEDLLIFSWGFGRKMTLKPYGEKGTGIDKAVLDPLRSKTGLTFANHTLRRTFARTLWLHAVRIETIGALLGHHSTEVTLRYIGVQQSDMSTALSALPFKNEKLKGGLEYE